MTTTISEFTSTPSLFLAIAKNSSYVSDRGDVSLSPCIFVCMLHRNGPIS